MDDKELLQAELRDLLDVDLLRVDGEPGEVRQAETFVAVLLLLQDAVPLLTVLALILGDLPEEQSVVELLLALLDHLGEAVCDCVTDALEEGGLLLAEDGHRIL